MADAQAPTVSMTAPADGATVSGSSVTLSASASDDVAVAGVTFKVNGVTIGAEDTSSPYSVTWDSTATSIGSNTIVAVARDTSNNYATSSSITVTVTADNTPPVISSIASSPAATTATVTWTTDESASSKVSYGTSSGTYTNAASSAALVTSHSIGLTSLSASTLYYYVVVSTDAQGNTATSTENTLTTTSSESITNGGFDSGTGWTLGTGWTISGGVANANVGAWAILEQSPPLTFTAGQTYQVSIDILTRVSGTLRVIVGPSVYRQIYIPGHYTFSLVAPAASHFYIEAEGSGFVGSIDNVSIQPPPPADTQAPTVPASLTASTVSSSQIKLAWSASTDNVGVTGYNIYRDGVLVGTSATASYNDFSLTPSTSYTYTVSAHDAAGNNSAQSSSTSATTTTQASWAILAFDAIPWTDPDIRAPGRGADSWMRQDLTHQGVDIPTAGAPQTAFDVYDRQWYWNDLESAQGVYDFSRIESSLHAAIDARQKLSIGVIFNPPSETHPHPTDQGVGMSYPLYLHQLMQNVNDPKNHGGTDWIPKVFFPGLGLDNWWLSNYNSEYYLDRLDALNAALNAFLNAGGYKGVAYKNVIENIEIGGFGRWGEWTHPHILVDATKPDGTPGSWPVGMRPTVATLKRIVDSYVKSFPDFQLVAMMESFDADFLFNTRNPAEIAQYVLDAHNNVGLLGWRRANWGSDAWYYHQTLDTNNRSFNGGPPFSVAIMDRWKFAPIVGEVGDYETDLALLPAQMSFYHVSMIGNGNFVGSYPFTQALRDNYRAAAKLTGYRIILTGGSTPANAALGHSFPITLNWQNIGVAPTYEHWNVRFELQDRTTGAVAWSGTSSLDLRLWLPQSNPTTVIDMVTIPTTLAVGNYRLVVKIVDPTGYRNPLPLAITGRRADGSYTLVDTFTVTTLPSTTNFQIGDHILTTANINIRATPAASGTLLGNQPARTPGIITGGPTNADGYLWWNVTYDYAPSGWSVQDYLSKTTSIPTVNISANTTSITSGQSLTLSWTSSNATSCTASGGWSGTKAVSGTQSVSPANMTTYTITCAGADGTSPAASATVFVNQPASAPSEGGSGGAGGGGGGGSGTPLVNTTTTSTTTTSTGITSTAVTALAASTSSESSSITCDTSATKSPVKFTRTLGLGSVGEDVRQLQVFLNARGFNVATSGPGSLGTESNVFGPKTEAALIRFQEANAGDMNLAKFTGLFGETTRSYVNSLIGTSTAKTCSTAPSGAAGSSSEIAALLAEVARLQALLNSLIAAKASNQQPSSIQVSFAHNLYIGLSGSDVSALQQLLKDQGYFTQSEITGYFGPATKDAVVAFQKDHNIAPLGGVGPQTRAVLNKIKLQ